jgi:hypothetical protein
MALEALSTEKVIDQIARFFYLLFGERDTL